MRLLLGLTLLALCGCSKEGTARKLLDATSTVYVQLAPESLTKMRGPKGPDEVGAVPSLWSDDDLVYVYRSHQEGEKQYQAMVIYTAQALIPAGSIYLTVTPNQAVELALATGATQALMVNPDSPASFGFVPKERMSAVLGQLTPRKPKLKGISLTGP